MTAASFPIGTPGKALPSQFYFLFLVFIFEVHVVRDPGE